MSHMYIYVSIPQCTGRFSGVVALFFTADSGYPTLFLLPRAWLLPRIITTRGRFTR